LRVDYLLGVCIPLCPTETKNPVDVLPIDDAFLASSSNPRRYSNTLDELSNRHPRTLKQVCQGGRTKLIAVPYIVRVASDQMDREPRSQEGNTRRGDTE
jgi:hypothetical protein